MSINSPKRITKEKTRQPGLLIHTARRRKKVKLRGLPIELRVAYVSGVWGFVKVEELQHRSLRKS